jgi:hypothetical protein
MTANRGTVPPDNARLAALETANRVLRAELLAAAADDGRPRRAFLRGLVIGGIAVGAVFIAGAAMSETIRIGRVLHLNGQAMNATTVTIAPSPEPGEWAIVTLDNRYVNDSGDDGIYSLPFDGAVIEARFQWDADPLLGADRITLTPPPGRDLHPRGLQRDRDGGADRLGDPDRLAGDVT